MDCEELIRQLRTYSYWLGQSGPESHDIHPKICDEAATAIEILLTELNVLRTPTSLTNAPLTMEELQKMDGEPVWVVIDGDDYAPCWMLLKYHAGRAFFSEQFSIGLDKYGEKWIAYRYKLSNIGTE